MEAETVWRMGEAVLKHPSVRLVHRSVSQHQQPGRISKAK